MFQMSSTICDVCGLCRLFLLKYTSFFLKLWYTSNIHNQTPCLVFFSSFKKKLAAAVCSKSSIPTAIYLRIISTVCSNILIFFSQTYIAVSDVCFSLFLQKRLQSVYTPTRNVDRWVWWLGLSGLSSLLERLKYTQYLSNHGLCQKPPKEHGCSLLPLPFRDIFGLGMFQIGCPLILCPEIVVFLCSNISNVLNILRIMGCIKSLNVLGPCSLPPLPSGYILARMPKTLFSLCLNISNILNTFQIMVCIKNYTLKIHVLFRPCPLGIYLVQACFKILSRQTYVRRFPSFSAQNLQIHSMFLESLNTLQNGKWYTWCFLFSLPSGQKFRVYMFQIFGNVYDVLRTVGSLC